MKEKSAKKLLSVLLALALLVGLVPGMDLTARAADIHGHTVLDGDLQEFKEPWSDSTKLPDKSGSYYLTTDVVLTNPWVIRGQEVTLCLNGHGIRMASAKRVITLEYDGTTPAVLNLYECHSAAYYQNDPNYKVTHYVTLTNWVGTSVSDTAPGQQGTYDIQSDTVPAGGSGAALGVDGNGNGVVEVKGGYITGGQWDTGAGVFIRPPQNGATEYSEFNMHGGTLLGNKARNSGGGIWNGGKLSLDTEKVRITCNRGGSARGGVYHTGAEFSISGAPNLTGNSGYDVVLNGADRVIHFADSAPKDGVNLGKVYRTASSIGPLSDGTKFTSMEQVEKVMTFPWSGRQTVVLNGDGHPELVWSYKVTLRGGANATAGGGATTQSNLYQGTTVKTPLDTVTYTAYDNCAFPAFDDITVGGVTVKRADPKTVTVTGTPTGSEYDLSLTVPDAVRLPNQTFVAPLGKTLTYNREAQELVHAGSAEGGTVQYALGDSAASAPTGGWSTSIPTGTNAGTYYVWYKSDGDAGHANVAPQVISVTIAKQIVDPPVVPPKPYIPGRVQVADLPESDLYRWVSGTDAMEVGEYDERAELTDPNNYKWRNSDEPSITVKFVVAEVLLPYADPVNYSPNLTLKDVPLVLPDAEWDWEWADPDTVPTVQNNGYAVKILVAEDYWGSMKYYNDYDPQTHIITKTIPLTVRPADPEVSVLPAVKTGLTYNGSAQELATAGEVKNGTLKYAVTENDTEPNEAAFSTALPTGVGVGTYYVWCRLDGDANYNSYAPVFATTSIGKGAPDVTPPTLIGLTYNGQEQKLVNPGSASAGTMQYALGANADSAPNAGWSTSIPTGTNAGTYYVWYRVVGAGNYSGSAPVCVTAVIAKAAAAAAAPTAKLNLTYNGARQQLADAPAAAEGVTMQYALGTAEKATEAYSGSIPAGTDAGTYYVWYKSAGDANHEDSAEQVVKVTIAKQIVDPPVILPKPYRAGENQTATVPTNDTYTVTKNNGGTEIGTYDVVLTLTNPGNYKWRDSDDAAITLKFEIARVPLPTAGAVDYDPNLTLEKVTLNNPVDWDWRWENPGEKPSVAKKDYAVVLEVSAEDAQAYKLTSEDGYDAQTGKVTRTIPLTVRPADPEVVVMPSQKTGLVYNGSAQALANGGEIQNGTLQYAVTGTSTEPADGWGTSVPEKTDAGTYYVWARVLGDENYNSYDAIYATVTIAKAALNVTPPTPNNQTYNGKAVPLVIAGAVEGGTMQYALGNDNKTAPAGGWSASIPGGDNAGTYYVWYRVPGDANHEGADAACVKVTISPKGDDVTETTYSVTYHATEKDTGFTVSGIAAGTQYILLNFSETNLSLPSRSAVFETWNLGGDAGKTSYDAGTAYTVNADVEFYAKWKEKGTVHPSSHSRSGGGGGSSSTSEPSYSVSMSIGGNSVSIGADVSQSSISLREPNSTVLTQISSYAARGGNAALDLTALSGTVASVTLPAALVRAVADAGNASMTMKLSGVSVTFDAKALAAIAESTSVSVELGVDVLNVADLNPEQRFAMMSEGTVERVYDISLTSGRNQISDFGGGKATVAFPYTLKAGQATGDLSVWYADAQGGKTELPSRYEGGEMSFDTGHFSCFVLVSAASGSAPAFTDLDSGAWYAQAVRWVVDHAVMNGMGNGTFAPYGTTTRAMVAQILYNLEGRPAIRSGNPFTDVSEDAWYAMAVTWAESEGLVTGRGDGTFDPNAPITREQLITIMYRYAAYKGVDTTAGEDTNLLSYDDFDAVSEYAIPALQWSVGTGLASGRTETTLNPADSANRAEVATILMRYCENIA